MLLGPICHSTNVLYGTKTISVVFGLWMTASSSKGDICHVVDRENMIQRPVNSKAYKHQARLLQAILWSISPGWWRPTMHSVIQIRKTIQFYTTRINNHYKYVIRISIIVNYRNRFLNKSKDAVWNIVPMKYRNFKMFCWVYVRILRTSSKGSKNSDIIQIRG